MTRSNLFSAASFRASASEASGGNFEIAPQQQTGQRIAGWCVILDQQNMDTARLAFIGQYFFGRKFIGQQTIASGPGKGQFNREG